MRRRRVRIARVRGITWWRISVRSHGAWWETIWWWITALRRICTIPHHLCALGSCRHRLAIPSLAEVVVWRRSERIVVRSVRRREGISLLVWRLVWRHSVWIGIVGAGYLRRIARIVRYSTPLPSSISRSVWRLHSPATAIPAVWVVVYLFQIGD